MVLGLCKRGSLIELRSGGEGKKTKIKAQITSVPLLGYDINEEKISLFFCVFYHSTSNEYTLAKFALCPELLTTVNVKGKLEQVEFSEF